LHQGLSIRRVAARVPTGDVGGEVSVEDAGAELEEQVNARGDHRICCVVDRAFLAG
jgi:hypothetical protein